MDNPEGTVPLDLNSVQGIPLGIGLVPPAIGMVHGMGMENPAMFMNMTTPMEGTFTHQPHFHQPTLMPAMSPVSSILSSLAGAPTPDNLTPLYLFTSIFPLFHSVFELSSDLFVFVFSLCRTLIFFVAASI
eukprot:TRINITY_DN2421_c0_g1_i5.p1 TRINITY_DN2421_c0_g1~~TRINITY_DN2421_c0_g1_i5.p1  ORF type:complete len:131 (+),score=13.05 TRINITY_DN2421_c0_g1_i5:120-512(+)